jgi:hypothetical protein
MATWNNITHVFKVVITLRQISLENIGAITVKEAIRMNPEGQALSITDAYDMVTVIPWDNIAYVMAHPSKVKESTDAD